MVSRGPSIHNTRKTANPFMTTSSSVVGINLHEPKAFDAPRLRPELAHDHTTSFSTVNSNNDASDNNASTSNPLSQFMYNPTSACIGAGVAVTQKRSELSRRMDKITLKQEIKDKQLVRIHEVDVVAPHDCALKPEELLPEAIDTTQMSKARPEHPMYSTTNREFGLEKAQLKVEMDRKGRPNTFTSSFNGFHYRDFGLSTAVTRSRICDQLDYS